MKVDLYMRYGDHLGEATGIYFGCAKLNTIDIVSSHIASGQGAGQSRPDRVAFTKPTDSISSALMNDVQSGAKNKVFFYYVKESGLPFLILELDGAYVDSINWSGRSDGGGSSESGKMGYDKINYISWAQTEPEYQKDKTTLQWVTADPPK